jgi:egghead protein (zeste-white 4 protein)
VITFGIFYWNVFLLSLSSISDTFIGVESSIKLYHLPIAILIYCIRLSALLPLPLAVCNTIGFILYNSFKEPSLQCSPQLSSEICIRVVTRGDYPLLIRDNVKTNLTLCDDIGLTNFSLEIVTNKFLSVLDNCDSRVKQVVIPQNYRSKKGSLFKARALQYAIEHHLLDENDWIVHLDEETLLTKNSLYGILNFINNKNDYAIGQGLITYGSNGIVNQITTLGDSIRVGIDLGLLRCCLKLFHLPIFLFKGSYIVCKASCEQAITFDNGANGSIAEDMYFAMRAMSSGYKFDWIEGEMLERSPFTLYDFIQQRKRWIQGLLLIVHDGTLPIMRRLCLGISVYSSVSTVLNIFIAPLYPVDLPLIVHVLISFIGGVTIYLYLIGTVRSLHLNRLNYFHSMMKILCLFICIPIVVVCETVAVIWGIFGKKNIFYVVQKQTNTQNTLSVLSNV